MGVPSGRPIRQKRSEFSAGPDLRSARHGKNRPRIRPSRREPLPPKSPAL
jgi:hypothetical protein